MKALLAAQDRGRGEGWCPHCQQALEQPGSSATEPLCQHTPEPKESWSCQDHGG